MWVVGDSEVRHWNGTALASDDRPPAATGFTAVYGTAPDDVWLIAGIDAYHWDGTAWSHTLTGSRGPVRHMGAVSSNDLFGVGDLGTITHFDGTRWQPMTTAAPDASGIVRMRGTAMDDVWALATDGAALHWDGTAWTRVAQLGSARGWDLFVPGPTEAWAATGDGVYHWDGTAWTRSVASAARSVWAAGPTDVWAGTSDGYVRHYDGVTWTSTIVDPGATSPPDVTGMWGSGANDVYAVESYISGSYYHYGGSAWGRYDFQPYPGYIYVSSVAMGGSGPSDLWIVGDKTFHYDGTSWTDTDSGGATDVWVAAPSDVWRAGGGAYHRSGTAWTDSGADPSMGTVWSDGMGGAVAGGGSGAQAYTP